MVRKQAFEGNHYGIMLTQYLCMQLTSTSTKISSCKPGEVAFESGGRWTVYKSCVQKESKPSLQLNAAARTFIRLRVYLTPWAKRADESSAKDVALIRPLAYISRAHVSQRFKLICRRRNAPTEALLLMAYSRTNGQMDEQLSTAFCSWNTNLQTMIVKRYFRAAPIRP